jgi:hypothetical protein
MVFINVFIWCIVGYVLGKFFIKLHEILTYKKDKPNPLDPFPVEVTLVYKYILLAGIVCTLVLFTKYITLPLIKYTIDLIRSLF